VACHRPGEKRDLLVAGLSWYHMPVDLVAEDVAQDRLVELRLRRRAWHLRPLVFVLSCLRGSKLSPFEERPVQLLAGRRPEVALAEVKRGASSQMLG